MTNPTIKHKNNVSVANFWFPVDLVKKLTKNQNSNILASNRAVLVVNANGPMDMLHNTHVLLVNSVDNLTTQD